MKKKEREFFDLDDCQKQIKILQISMRKELIVKKLKKNLENDSMQKEET